MVRFARELGCDPPGSYGKIRPGASVRFARGAGSYSKIHPGARVRVARELHKVRFEGDLE